MKQKIHDLALEAGGSHYPTVGGATLEKFAELLIAECIRVVEATPRHCAMTTFQESIVDCTIDASVKALKEHFE
jgi:hypothetical protein